MSSGLPLCLATSAGLSPGSPFSNIIPPRWLSGCPTWASVCRVIVLYRLFVCLHQHDQSPLRAGTLSNHLGITHFQQWLIEIQSWENMYRVGLHRFTVVSTWNTVYSCFYLLITVLFSIYNRQPTLAQPCKWLNGSIRVFFCSVMLPWLPCVRVEKPDAFPWATKETRIPH